MLRRVILLAVIAVLLGVPAWRSTTGTAKEPASSADQSTKADLRRPVAAVLLDRETTVAVANSRTGSISLVSLSDRKVLSETVIAKELGGLATVEDGTRLLATDPVRHELLVVQRDSDARANVIARHATSRHPRTVAVSANSAMAGVAAQWAHRVDLFDLTSLNTAQKNAANLPRRTVEVPFPPLELLWLPDGQHVLAADTFSGRLAVIDAVNARLVSVRELTGHNIRGLTLDAAGENVYMSHQVLDEWATINWQTVHSGTLMGNAAARIPVAQLLDGKGSLDGVAESIPLSNTGHGGGDPAGLLVLADGSLTACLAGTSEVILVNRFGVLTQRYSVGSRPTQLLPLKDGKALVVNRHGDSLDLLDWTQDVPVATIPLGPQRPLKAAERGELLFYDSRLSHDGWLSCHSCHTDGHTNGLRADTQGDGTSGAPKRVLGLGHVAFTDKWAWSGRVQELYDQVRKSLLTSMLSDDVRERDVNDLVAYLETLLPPPPSHPSDSSPDDRDAVARGRNVFLGHQCQGCHVPPLTYTASDVYDVGLKDENGQRKFNPPSLRGVGHARRLFHDNRAESLEDVFQGHGHPSDTALSDKDLADLVRFLRSL
jgi:hypothetical protein